MSSENCQLADIAFIQGGYAFKSADFGNEGVAVVKIANIKPPVVSLDSVDRVRPDKLSGLDRFRLNDGDVLMAMTGATVGKVGRFRETEPAYLNQRVARISAHHGKKYDDFIYAVVSQPGFDSLIGGASAGSAQANISAAGIGAVQIPLLSGNEQLAIGQLARILDDRISLLRETSGTLEAIAQALFKSWFVDFDPVRAKSKGRAPEGMDEATAALFPDSFEESALGLVPNGWRIGSLKDLATFQNGCAFKSKDWSKSGHPVVKIGNVKPGLISFDGCSFVSAVSVGGLDRFRLSRGDLLVGMTGYVGETGLVPDVTPTAYLNQRVGRIATKEGVADLGLAYCIVRQKEFKSFAEGQSHGSAQANVSGADLMKFTVIAPTTEILSSFNLTLSVVIESILSNHEQAQTLVTLRDTLLPRLISGQLRLPESVEPSELASAILSD